MRLGIRAKLFGLSLGVIAVSVVAADLYLSGALDRLLIDRIRQDLFVRLDLIARQAASFARPLDDMAAWDALADELGRRARARVTLIGRDGAVAGDSEVAAADLSRLENHARRPELVDAVARGRGSSTRFSSTLHERMLYAAVPLRRGGEVVGLARIAMPLTEVDRAIAQMRGILAVATLVALAIAILMSTAATHLASRTLRAVTGVARRMAAGDLAGRTRATGSDEFAELGRTLDQLAESLARTLDDLRRERDLSSGILAGMREGVLLLGPERRIVLLNPALREMLLVGPHEAGRPLLEVVRHAELNDLLGRAASSGQPTTGEIEIASSLRPRRLLVHAAPVTGVAPGLLAVLVDVTDMRRLEAMRRDFVANVSHELRTPVAAVRSAVETLRGAAAADPTATEPFLALLERNAERLYRLVEDLLDLSRIESRELRLDRQPLDLGAVVAHVLSFLAPEADKRGVRLDAAIAEGLPKVLADRRALEQILGNLVDNAIKYGAGPITVRARTLGGDGGEEVVRVSVEDRGPGIAAEHLPRLFERFYRVDPGRSREVGGTGLGLSIVKHLVEAMGGQVAVESEPSKGSSFGFTLQKAA